METKFGGKAGNLYGPVVSDLKAVGKKSLEWDLNDWKWDGDLFTAVPLNSVPSDCRSKQFFSVGSEIPATVGYLNGSSTCPGEVSLGAEKGKREMEKRRRVVAVQDEELNNETRSFNLMLGGQVYPIMEDELEKCDEKNGKKAKVVGAATNRAVCQVEDCGVDLSSAKDYHRRHKVCEIHSKASKATVGNVLQRFCQQCSRFHVLQEFDEGKRSCRRRLAGHNKRRRKTHPENVSNGVTVNDDRGSSYLLVSLLRILSNIHSNSSDQTNDQDLLSHLLRNLANHSGTVNERNTSDLLPRYQDFPNAGTSVENHEKDHPRPDGQHINTASESKMPQKRICIDMVQGVAEQSTTSLLSAIPLSKKGCFSDKVHASNTNADVVRLNNFDLNNVYDDSQGFMESFGGSMGPVNVGDGSHGCPLWVHQDSSKSSPPQMSMNSGSTATPSPSSSSEEAQSRTDRIVFKLFGKDPGDFPLSLRKQILDWLSHSPMEIESYIRPGCIIFTIYLRMEKGMWEELFNDLRSCLRQLLSSQRDTFWNSGWIYARVHDRIAFVYNGHVVLDASLPFRSRRACEILRVKPIAVSGSEKVQFKVEGYNLSLSTSRMLCALEGKYLGLKICSDLIEGADSSTENDEIQSLSFSCSIPHVIGRGFIEVEDHGLSSSFFPFIVAEQDVCSELRTLEGDIELNSTDHGLLEETERVEMRSRAYDFIHEMGWLLHRHNLKMRLGRQDPTSVMFSFNRYRRLMEFSVDRDWCAVVKKLLNILFKGTVDAGEYPSVELALADIELLHRAVLRNCRPMVEVLLRYHLDEVLDKAKPERKQQIAKKCYLFRPDAIGPGGLTPLHIAASREGCENVLDALTDDPEQVGLEAWRNARDSAGLTPSDYADMRGHHTYIHLVQKKINNKMAYGHVVLDVHSMLLDCNMKQKLATGYKSAKVASFHTETTLVKPIHGCCQICEQKFANVNASTLAPIYRPAMLSMVAIAAVCVCVALLFKSSPEVFYVFRPFRWELLKYGSS